MRNCFSGNLYTHYRITNTATMIIKTTHALNVPPTAAGVAFDTSTNGSSFISKNDTKRNILGSNEPCKIYHL